jgi:dihydroorotase
MANIGSKRKFQAILHEIFKAYMKILLRKVSIADAQSPYNGQVKDILIEEGKIVSIADNVTATDDTSIVDEKDAVISQGWVDGFSHFNDPGFEFKETLETGAATAAAGGFTDVFALPNTNPVVQSKTQVEYIVQKSKSLPVNIHPLGSITKNNEGKELAEMYDMQASGAIAFSDGLNPVQTSGLLLKALQYVKAFDGVVVQVPIDTSIGKFGLMNEGIVSTQLGLPGIPIMGEELMVARDIKLARYADSKLHFTGVSSPKSLEYIKRAKDAGLQVTCSVTPYHLFFCDEDIKSYDTNLKVNPPLRTRKDMEFLREAVLDGTVDCIASHHQPHDWDNKVCEFEYAKYGMIGLQTAYATVNHILPQLSNEKLIKLFSSNARNIFGLPSINIAEGSVAALTIFNRNGNTVLTKLNNKSRSTNSPFLDMDLNGKVIGTVSKGKLILN